MKWLTNKICDWFHKGGDIKRDSYGRINWQCRTCKRWNDAVDKQTEKIITDAHIKAHIHTRGEQ